MSMAQLLAELQAEYIKTFPQKVETMTRLWNEKNLEGLEDEFHRIKGTGKSYGLPEVSILGEAMEKICAAQVPELAELIPLATGCLNRIHHERSNGQVPEMEKWDEFSKIASARKKI